MIHFGTGGFRAIIGEDFTRRNVELIAQALSNIIIKEHKQNKAVIIGYDRRFLSDIAAKWICCVFAGNNIPVHLINHEAPTPMIMFEVKAENSAYGLAVTASHNPAEYNGIKVFTSGGYDAPESVTKQIETEIEKIGLTESIPSLNWERAVKRQKITCINPQNRYIDSILEFIDINAIKDKDIKILLDPMYGVSKTTLQTILLTCRCNVDVIHDRHDTLFGGRLPAPNNATLTHLSQMVVQGHYDMGIATDGDADRIGLIDANGNFIHPNDILVLLYYYLHEYKGWKGSVVRNVATTHCLDKMAESFGEKCYEVPVGFKYISAEMEKKDAIIGGESSGGLTVRGHIHGKDGVYAGALLTEMLCVIGKPLSDVLKEIHEKFGFFYMQEFSYTVSPSLKSILSEILFVKRKIPNFSEPISSISYLDGCKIYFENGGWIICRFSGTEPLLRIFCEMDSQKKAEEICSVFENFIKQIEATL